MAESWEILETLGTEEEASLVCGFLESQGIPCQVESALSHEFPVNAGALASVRVEVPTDHLGEARRLLAEVESSPAPAADEGEGEGPGEGLLARLRQLAARGDLL